MGLVKIIPGSLMQYSAEWAVFSAVETRPSNSLPSSSETLYLSLSELQYILTPLHPPATSAKITSVRFKK